MIDLKRLRDEPEYRRGIERKRVRPGLIDEVLALDEARRARIQEVDTLRARQNAASKEIGQRRPEERPAKIAAAQTLEGGAQRGGGRAAEDRGRVPRAGVAGAEPGRRVGARRRRGRRRRARRSSARAAEAPPLDHAAFSDAIGFVDTVRGAEASGSRFAYIMREAVLLEFALVNYAMQRAGRARLRAGRHAGARARAHDGGGRLLPDRPRAGVRRRRRRAVPHRHERSRAVGAAPRRDAHPRPAAAPLRRLLDVLPARGRHVRQGHARHLPRAPVRQGRDVLVLRPDRLVGRARADPGDRAAADRRARPAVPRRQHRRRRSRPGGREEVRHRGVASRPKVGTASSQSARTTPTTRRAGWARGSRANAGTSWCTR